MKKIVLFALVAAMALSVFIGCGKQEEPQPSATPVVVESGPEEQATPESASEATAEPQGIPDAYSPTTGLTDTTTEYKPVIVQVENEPAGRSRQYGLQSADVVYETMIEGVDTRYTALFNDVIWKSGAPAELTVGPVRSSRYYHQWIQGDWDALYVHQGGPDSTGNPESDIWGASGEHIRQRINGAGRHSENAQYLFALLSGYSESDYAGTDVIEDATIFDFTPNQEAPLQFYPQGDYSARPEVGDIQLPWYVGDGWATYTYHADTDKLTRMTDGREAEDASTGEEVQIQNLIIQYTLVTLMPNDLGGRRKVDVIGEGNADFIINGRHVRGTWERPSGSDHTTYKDEDGNVVSFAPGNTWISIHPDTTAVVINYADGSSYESDIVKR